MTTATSAVDDLIAALGTAQRAVFRFEGRQDYPDELFDAARRGEDWAADPELSDWCALVSDTVSRGVSWVRARVVLEPRTPYTAWEIDEHFPHNLAAGEDIRVIRADAPWGCADFWLVDDRVWVLDYGSEETMTVGELPPGEVWKARGWRDEAMAVAVALRVSAST